MSTSRSSHSDTEEEKGEEELVTTSTSHPPSPQPHAHGDWDEKDKSAEKGSLGRVHSTRRHLNDPAIPGVPLDDDDDSDLVGGGDDDESERQGDDNNGDDLPRPSGGIVGVLERVVSRASTKSSWNPGPPPDGGVKAWTAGEWVYIRLFWAQAGRSRTVIIVL